jgi:hypothetical protein
MLLFVISNLFLFSFLFLSFNFLNKFQLSEKILGVYILCCSYIILVLELAGMLEELNNPIVILFIQASMVFLAFILNRILKSGYPKISVPHPTTMFKGIVEFIRREILVVLFFFLIIITYLFLAYIQVRFPQNTADSLLNHLSRIGHWLQQGSLKPYAGFNEFGSTFPFINSLLMLWSVVFLRSDRLVGYVQFVAAIMIAISIYSMGKEFGFTRKASFFAGLFFLTFPIILFESITAQNDLLAACFLMIAFYFLIRFIYESDGMILVLSILSFALAIGTKQYALFALPGYITLYALMIKKRGTDRKMIVLKSILSAICFIFIFSSYSYLQNFIFYGNPGGAGVSSLVDSPNPQISGTLNKAVTNSLRLVYQFLDCEGIPPVWETACINGKASFLRPVLANSIINIEGTGYKFDASSPFTLIEQYTLNEESSWYGMIACVLILLAIPFAMIRSIKIRKFELVILLFTSFTFFLITATIKKGWDPYVGRYLIFSTALLIPLSAGFLDGHKWPKKILIGFMCAISVFIMVYSVLNNDSHPLMSKTQFLSIQLWGKENLPLVQKIAARVTPFIRHEDDVWTASDETIKTFGNKKYLTPLLIVEKYVPENSTLGIMSPPGYVFPDYLFFGDSFRRILVIFTNPGEIRSNQLKIDFLLISPDFNYYELSESDLVIEQEYWRLYQTKEEK